MRRITHIVLHCTATPQGTSIASIQRHWREVNKWKSPGYHYIIEASGNVQKLHHLDKPSNGVKGHNANSIHISYIGGVDGRGNPIDNRTAEQICKQVVLILKLKSLYPDAEVCGHRDFLQKGKPGWKDCPSFDVKSWLKSVDL